MAKLDGKVASLNCAQYPAELIQPLLLETTENHMDGSAVEVVEAAGKDEQKTPTPMTPSVCHALAAAAGYAFYAVQNGKECWAGPSYGAYDRAPPAACDVPCKGNEKNAAGETCGGATTNDVFSVDPKKEGDVKGHRDCTVDEWGPSNDCFACQTTHGQTRTVVTMPRGAGARCPALARTQPCSASSPPCPVDCQVSAWSEWSACTSCVQVRSRTVQVVPQSGGAECLTPMKESRACGNCA